MSSTDMTTTEMTESLTGFDEIAITQHMGTDPYDAKPVALMRSLVFVHLRRQGTRDADARNEAMNMTLKGVQDYFAEEPLSQEEAVRLTELRFKADLTPVERAERDSLAEREAATVSNEIEDETPAGNDVAAPEPQPTNSQPSAS